MIIAGVDEAGRGPLAGPVVSAAVILNPQSNLRGLNDSKKLSVDKRKLLFKEVPISYICTTHGLSFYSIYESISLLFKIRLIKKNYFR
mgnify:CR=1 FL=1